MSDKNSRFRKSLVGFHRSDVLDYLEQKSHEHNEQRNELARKLEDSQNQLGVLQQRLAELEIELKAARDEVEVKNSEIDRLGSELDGLNAANAELTEKNAALENELGCLRAERDSLAADLADINAQKEEIEQAKLHVAEIELEAYARAKKIEGGALENANLARETLSNLIQDVKRRFDKARDNATQTLLQMASELDRLKEVLNHLPESFESISSEIESLRFGTDKRNTVQETADDRDSLETGSTPPFSEGFIAGTPEYDSIVYPEDEELDVSGISESYTFPAEGEGALQSDIEGDTGGFAPKRDTEELLFFRPQEADTEKEEESAEGDIDSSDNSGDDGDSTPGLQSEGLREAEY